MTAQTPTASRSGFISQIASPALPIVFILIWSSGYLVGSIGSRHGSPLALVAWRLALALVALGGFAMLTRANWPRRPIVWIHLMVIGILLQTAQLGGIYLGLGRGVSAGLSSLALSATPMLVAALAVPLFGERMSGWQWVGLLLGLAGVGISLSGKLTGGDARQLAGFAFTGLAVLGFAAGTLYQKKFGAQVDLRAGTTIQLLGAAAAAFPLAALHGGLAMPRTGEGIFALVWLALVNSIGSFVLLFVLLRRRTGGAATSLLYLVPPVTALIGVPLLGQSISVGVFVGMAVSAVGVLLVLLGAGGTGDRPAEAALTDQSPAQPHAAYTVQTYDKLGG